MMDFDMLLQLRSRYLRQGYAEETGGTLVNLRSCYDDGWTPDTSGLTPSCSCGNLLTIEDVGDMCRQCRWQTYFTRKA